MCFYGWNVLSLSGDRWICDRNVHDKETAVDMAITGLYVVSFHDQTDTHPGVLTLVPMSLVTLSPTDGLPGLRPLSFALLEAGDCQWYHVPGPTGRSSSSRWGIIGSLIFSSWTSSVHSSMSISQIACLLRMSGPPFAAAAPGFPRQYTGAGIDSR